MQIIRFNMLTEARKLATGRPTKPGLYREGIVRELAQYYVDAHKPPTGAAKEIRWLERLWRMKSE